MTKSFLPKIKVNTIKNTAQKMVESKYGSKQVTPTAFKKFLQQDKDLKKYAYASGQSSVSKFQAKKFISQVASKVTKEKNLKINPVYTKKMGIKIGPQGKISDIGFKKIYQQAENEEIKQMAPTGPTKEDIERQKKRERAIETFHKRETADEIRQAEKEKAEGTSKGATPSKSTGPVQIQQGGSAGSSAASSISDEKSQIKSTQSGKSAFRKKIKQIISKSFIILPFSNLSQSKNLDWIAEKITNTAIRIIMGIKNFNLIERKTINQIILASEWERTKIITPELAQEIHNKIKTDSTIFGNLKKIGNQIQVFVYLIQDTHDPKKIVEIKEETEDVFELEKKLNWQLLNYFEERKEKPDKDSQAKIPSPTEAEDLPI